jgi:hypothetical protein
MLSYGMQFMNKDAGQAIRMFRVITRHRYCRIIYD